MKSQLGLVALVAILIGLAAGCNKADEDMQPILEDAGLKQAIQGKWRIERVNNKLCRSDNCSSVVYYGKEGDYFEFKADSAFLQRMSTRNASSVYRDSFKADYSKPSGSFMLSNFGWSALFKVLQNEGNRLVLEGTYNGADPSAVFTDTYYLYR